MILNETQKTVSIITFTSTNQKTGDMAQIWILNKNINPVDAIKNGDDINICFDCTHRTNGTCYVNAGQAPLQVYKAYKKGLYSQLDLDVLKGVLKWKAVRFGAYGEPILIPLNLVKFIVKHARAFTGYSHQWQNLKYDDYKPYFMASVDTSKEVIMAHAMQWRTFRVKGDTQANISGEIDCPNITHGVQCRDCTLCDGQGVGKSIVVNVHGTKGKINKFNQISLQNI